MTNSAKTIINSAKGFTLIELLVVIAVIGVLTAIVITVLNPAKRITDATEKRIQQELKQAATIVEACITTEYSRGNTVANIFATNFIAGTASCGNTQYLIAQNYTRNFPTQVAMTSNPGVSICLMETINSSTFWYGTNTGSIGNTQPDPNCV